MKSSTAKKNVVSLGSNTRKVAVTFTSSMYKAINSYSKKYGVSFSEAARTFIKRGME